MTANSYEIKYTNNLARIGKLTTKHGTITTPTFFPVNNLGGKGGWNTPRYWEIFPELRTSMINAFFIHNNHRNIRDRILTAGGIHEYLDFNGIVFADSGGYLGLKKNININQEEILKVQQELGVDIAATVDYPFNMKRDQKLYDKMIQSVLNARKIISKNSNGNMLIYASVHGNEPVMLKNILKYLNKRDFFDGYAIGSMIPIRTDFKRVIELVLAARSTVQNKPLHVFGLGGFLTISLLAYLGVDSVDSTSYIICGGKRRYFVPGYHEISMAEIEDYGELPCSCPICSSNKFEDLRASRDLITLHNLWALWNELKMTRFAIFENRLEKYLETRFIETPILKNAFEYAKIKMRHLI